MKDGHENTARIAQPNDEKKSRGGWAFPALLFVVLVVAAWLGRQESESKATQERGEPATTAWTPSPQAVGETVGLTIDFGNGATKQFAALPWRKGLTIEHLMQLAADYRPGITFSQQGQGEKGLLASIEGLKNQGAGGRNWLYRVNGKHGKMSFCISPLEPGDQVLWGFAIKE